MYLMKCEVVEVCSVLHVWK